LGAQLLLRREKTAGGLEKIPCKFREQDENDQNYKKIVRAGCGQQTKSEISGEMPRNERIITKTIGKAQFES